MNEENKIVEEQESEKNLSELKKTMEEKFAKAQSQNMILGFRVASREVLRMIVEFENSPGKKSNNDYKRIVKKIKEFCNRSLSPDNRNDENSSSEENTTIETVQN